MKPIFEENRQDFIWTDEINESHIVVGIIQKKPVILFCRVYGKMETLSFLCINERPSIGNAFPNYDGFKTIKDVIEYRLNEGHKIEVFEEKDWKQALQWLIDNAE